MPRPDVPSMATMRPSLSSMSGSFGGCRSGSRSDTSRRTAFSSTSSSTGVFREEMKPMAQFQMRLTTKPSWSTSRAAATVASRRTDTPSSGAPALNPPSGASTSTSADE